MGRTRNTNKTAQTPEAAQKERAIDRINALLNTAAEGSGATDAERDTALKLAVEIMKRHAIDEGELRLATKVEDIEHRMYDSFIKNKFEVKEWRRWTAHAVASAFMVKSYNIGSDRFIFVGRPSDIDIAEQVYKSLINQLQLMVDRDAAVSLKDHKHGGVGAKGGLDPLAWRKNYLEAAAMVLSHRLHELAATKVTHDTVPEEETENVVNAIVLVQDEAIKDYMGEHFQPVKMVKSKHNMGQYNASAVEAGRKAGNEAHISDGIEAGSSDPAPLLS